MALACSVNEKVTKKRVKDAIDVSSYAQKSVPKDEGVRGLLDRAMASNILFKRCRVRSLRVFS